MKLKTRDGRALDLSPEANAFAVLLRQSFPGVVFTSGRRDVDEQARAMASNVVSTGNRHWISDVYLYRPIAVALTLWLAEHPSVVTLGAIANGLAGVMRTFPPAELGKLSLHLSGDAFDVLPLPSPRGDAVHSWLTAREAAGEIKFLDREGGAVRWHVQVRRKDAPAAAVGVAA